MERNGYLMSHDIMSQQQAKKKKDPMSIFLRKQPSKTSKKNKSQHKLNEVSKYKTGNRKSNGKR
jgi:hypothetical protein